MNNHEIHAYSSQCVLCLVNVHCLKLHIREKNTYGWKADVLLKKVETKLSEAQEYRNQKEKTAHTHFNP